MKIRTLVAIAAVGLAAASAPTFAVTFANFTQQVTDPQTPFVFTNASTGSGFLTQSIPVDFTFEIPNGTGLETPIQATMVLTAVAVPGGYYTAGPFVGQTFSSLTATFTATSGPFTGDNLLTVNSTALVQGLTGVPVNPPNHGTAGLSADTGAGDTVTYSSDFLNFAGGADNSYSFEFTSLTQKLAKQLAATGKMPNVLKSFDANGTGSFTSDPTPTFGVPEPNPALALLIGAAGLGLLFVRNRKTAVARP